MKVFKYEQGWIDKMAKLMKAKPKNLLVYCVDTSLTVCKRGISSNDFQDDVGDIQTPCAFLADVHDDSGYGEHPKVGFPR